MTSHTSSLPTDDNESQLVSALNREDLRQIEELIEKGKCTLQSVLWAATGEGHDFCLPFLLPAHDISEDALTALWRAADEGHANCVDVIVKHLNLTAQGGDALKTAARGGFLECVKILAPISSEEALREALTNAAHGGHLLCLQHLLECCPAHQGDGRMAEVAARQGHLDCLRAAWPVCRPEDGGARILAGAIYSNRQPCIDYVMMNIEPETCQVLVNRISGDKGLRERPGCQYFLSLCQAQEIKADLHGALADSPSAARGKTKQVRKI